MNIKTIFSRAFLLLGVALTGFPGGAWSADYESHWLEVRVLDKYSGKPIPGAAVCVGTQAKLDQYGARRSDANGVVRYRDLLPHRLVVTASSQGFQGKSQVLEALNQSRVLVLKLATGGGGPDCSAAPVSVAGDASSGLAIDAVSVRKASADGAANSVVVAVRASGMANQIRISEKPDFAGAAWQQLQASTPYQLSAGTGLKQLYVQIRRVAQAQGASIEVISPVKQVQYRAR